MRLTKTVAQPCAFRLCPCPALPVPLTRLDAIQPSMYDVHQALYRCIVRLHEIIGVAWVVSTVCQLQLHDAGAFPHAVSKQRSPSCGSCRLTCLG